MTWKTSSSTIESWKHNRYRCPWFLSVPAFYLEQRLWPWNSNSTFFCTGPYRHRHRCMRAALTLTCSRVRLKQKAVGQQISCLWRQLIVGKKAKLWIGSFIWREMKGSSSRSFVLRSRFPVQCPKSARFQSYPVDVSTFERELSVSYIIPPDTNEEYLIMQSFRESDHIDPNNCSTSHLRVLCSYPNDVSILEENRSHE
jgi:hypothetical protein